MKTRKVVKPIPVVFFGSKFLRKVIDFKPLVEMNMVSAEDLSAIYYSDDVEDAFDFVTKYLKYLYLQNRQCCCIVPFMTFVKKSLFFGLILLVFSAKMGLAEDAEERFEARAKSLVVIKFSLQYDVDRETVTTYGLVVDNKGGIVVLPGCIPSWLPTEMIQNIKVFPLDQKNEGYSAAYLGEDYRTSWHYFKADPGHSTKFTSVTDWERTTPKVTGPVWGIGVMHVTDYFHKPVYMKSYVGAIEDVPYALAVCANSVSAVGGPVFEENGKFVGWATSSFSRAYALKMNGEQYDVLLQPEQSTEAFITSKTLYEYLLKEPIGQLQRKWPWLGLVGIEALDIEAAKFLGIEKQSALVISEVVEGSPASESGMEARDIITGINGKTFKKYASNTDLPYAFHLQFSKYLPGKELKLSIIRNGEKKEVTVELGKMPKRIKHAQRNFYSDAGFSIRELVYEDAVRNHYFKMDYAGVIIQYVQAGSLADTAELLPGDWVKEIDSKRVITYDDARNSIDAAVNEEKRDAIVLLVTRQDETKLIRLKLK